MLNDTDKTQTGVTFATGVGGATVIGFSDAEYGGFILAGATNCGTVSWYGGVSHGATFRAIKTAAGVAATSLPGAAAVAVAMPDACKPYRFLKGVAVTRVTNVAIVKK